MRTTNDVDRSTRDIAVFIALAPLSLTFFPKKMAKYKGVVKNNHSLSPVETVMFFSQAKWFSYYAPSFRQSCDRCRLNNT